MMTMIARDVREDGWATAAARGTEPPVLEPSV
jgi:hypothetical protein